MTKANPKQQVTKYVVKIMNTGTFPKKYVEH